MKMKRFLYSAYTKAAAAALFTVVLALAANVLYNGIDTFKNQSIGEMIYEFERDFQSSDIMRNKLFQPFYAVESAYSRYETEVTDAQQSSYGKVRVASVSRMVKRLENIRDTEFYIEIDGDAYSNCSETEKEYFFGQPFYMSFEKDSSGAAEYETNAKYYPSFDMLHERLDEYGSGHILIYAAIPQRVAESYRLQWEAQCRFIRELFYELLIFAVVALALLVYLIAVCGRRYAEEGIFHVWTDRIWTEVQLAVFVSSVVFSVLGAAMIMIEYTDTNLPDYIARAAVTGVAFAGGVLFETALLSMVRNLKDRRFFKTSVAVWCILFLWRIAGKLWRRIRAGAMEVKGLLSRKSGAILIVMLLVYTGFIGFCGLLLQESAFWFFAALLVFGAVCVFLGARAGDLDKIQKGTAAIKNGNLTYKLADIRSEDYRYLAENINNIGEGLSASVEEKLRAERMKTELVTNVSHDLKTPLTSIINYTKLLEEMELVPQEARDYVKIIAKKSERLKNLTSDLFEISRVQSGNETILQEKLDVALLISQSLGEQDNEISGSELTFCVDTEEELYIMADGRKMSRVMSNLIGNALKYAMKHTRVFVTAHAQESKVVIELKNISAYPIDFSADEITERFVRGDKSRTEEGNGLGLAIAKGYTEACGGHFQIITDGDMFKAVMKFDKM